MYSTYKKCRTFLIRAREFVILQYSVHSKFQEGMHLLMWKLCINYNCDMTVNRLGNSGHGSTAHALKNMFQLI